MLAGQQFNFALKVTLIGDAKAGKSSLLSRFIGGSFTDKYRATIGAAFQQKQVEDKEISKPPILYFWDMAGQERYAAIARGYYPESDIVFLIVDLEKAQKDSINYLKKECEVLKDKLKNKDAPIYLVGNKFDLFAAQKEMKEEDAQQSALQYLQDVREALKDGLNFCQDANNPQDFKDFICSAKTGVNVIKVFEPACKLAKERAKELEARNRLEAQQPSVVVNQVARSEPASNKKLLTGLALTFTVFGVIAFTIGALVSANIILVGEVALLALRIATAAITGVCLAGGIVAAVKLSRGEESPKSQVGDGESQDGNDNVGSVTRMSRNGISIGSGSHNSTNATETSLNSSSRETGSTSHSSEIELSTPPPSRRSPSPTHSGSD